MWLTIAIKHFLEKDVQITLKFNKLTVFFAHFI